MKPRGHRYTPMASCFPSWLRLVRTSVAAGDGFGAWWWPALVACAYFRLTAWHGSQYLVPGVRTSLVSRMPGAGSGVV